MGTSKSKAQKDKFHLISSLRIIICGPNSVLPTPLGHPRPRTSAWLASVSSALSISAFSSMPRSHSSPIPSPSISFRSGCMFSSGMKPAESVSLPQRLSEDLSHLLPGQALCHQPLLRWLGGPMASRTQSPQLAEDCPACPVFKASFLESLSGHQVLTPVC